MGLSTNADLTLYSFSATETTSTAGFAATGLNWTACGSDIPNTSDGDDGWMQRATVASTGTYAGTGTTTANDTGGTIVLALIQSGGGGGNNATVAWLV
jgi:hypothetical protein